MPIKNFDKLLSEVLDGSLRATILFNNYYQNFFFEREELYKALNLCELILNSKDSSNLKLAAALNLRGSLAADDANAKYYYQKAASLGNSIAECNLAELESDSNAATSLYQKAAAKNNYYALLKLEDIYKKGSAYGDIQAGQYKKDALKLMTEAEILYFKFLYAEDQDKNLADLDRASSLGFIPALILKAKYDLRLEPVFYPAVLAKFKSATGYTENELKLDIKIGKELSEFDLIFSKLRVITRNLAIKKAKHSKNYSKVYLSALRIYDKLSVGLIQLYVYPSIQRLEDFRELVKKEINLAELEFEQHRGIWYKLHPILRGFLGILATITIIPALAVLVANKHGYTQTFFSLPDTETFQQWGGIKKEFNQKLSELEIKEEKETVMKSRF